MEEAEKRQLLSWWRLAEMNLGFLGLQFSFGLQQSNMGPIYGFLGATEAALPLLWLAGPVTGLVVQPLIGAISDRTRSRWGRRTPYFIVGAVICSVCLWLMPMSRSLLAAASLLWILDAANNVTMEPYRAYAADRLRPAQLPAGFLMQSAFTGLAQTLSYLAPSMMVWIGIDRDLLDANGIPVATRLAFTIGAVLSIVTILWSVVRVGELPSTRRPDAAAGMTIRQVAVDLVSAVADMPPPLRRLAVAMLFQWYAMFAYWQFVVFALSRSVFGTADVGSAGFREAALVSGQVGAFYNLVAFLAAFAMVPVVRRRGAVAVHAVSLTLSGLAMLSLPLIHDRVALFIPMVGIGIGWASMMGNPYVLLARAVPPQRMGAYMGLFNVFIVLPMIAESLTMPLVVRYLIGPDPRSVLAVAGGIMLVGAFATARIRRTERAET